MVDWLKIYHRLPHPMRVAAVAVRGYCLHSRRYGRDTERLIAEASEREQWRAGEWKEWREERLAFLLRRAATWVPFYRDQWNERRRKGDKASFEYLENWPILKKETLRGRERQFIAEDCEKRKMFRDSTSGTTGTPLSIYVGREPLQKWYALFEARTRRWHGISSRERWGILGGQLVVPFAQRKPPFGVFNPAMNQLYLSTHHISRENAAWYFKALKRRSPTHLIVYPSSAAALAGIAVEQGLAHRGVKVIFSNAELLLDDQRKLIEKVFGCPVRNTYGMGELAAGASECGNGSMHLWPEAGHIEIVDDANDFPARDNAAGRIIATGLLNTDMPLIRYEVGDRGRLAAEDSRCGCGRRLPVLEKIEGRLNDIIITPDGRRVFWLNPVFYGLPVREAQLIQEELDCIRVLLVTAPGYTHENGDEITRRLRDRLGRMKIILEQTDHIPRTASGKFRAVVSLLDGKAACPSEAGR